jgi:hypothetical protein
VGNRADKPIRVGKIASTRLPTRTGMRRDFAYPTRYLSAARMIKCVVIILLLGF